MAEPHFFQILIFLLLQQAFSEFHYHSILSSGPVNLHCSLADTLFLNEMNMDMNTDYILHMKMKIICH